MDEEDKLLKMYKIVHGEPGRSFDIVVYHDADDVYCDPAGVKMVTPSDCGTKVQDVSYFSKTDLLFDYITRSW